MTVFDVGYILNSIDGSSEIESYLKEFNIVTNIVAYNHDPYHYLDVMEILGQ